MFDFNLLEVFLISFLTVETDLEYVTNFNVLSIKSFIGPGGIGANFFVAGRVRLKLMFFAAGRVGFTLICFFAIHVWVQLTLSVTDSGRLGIRIFRVSPEYISKEKNIYIYNQTRFRRVSRDLINVEY